jgi:predicted acylesterase/phospholipase RssA
MATQTRSLQAVLLASLLVHAAPAHSQIDPEATEKIPVIISASGGISRGAYQAGVNWALVQVFRGSRNREFRERTGINGYYHVAVATGASAGNVNATFTAIEDCDARRRPQRPEQSLFWKLWVNMGLDQLFDSDIREYGAATSLFTRRYVDLHAFPAVMTRMSSDSVRTDCEIPIGITLTRVRPGDIAIGPDRLGAARVTAATQRYATLFTIKAQQNRLIFARTDSSIWLNNGRLGKLILGPSLSGTEVLDTAWVSSAMQASGAFPIAFQPMLLSYRDANTVTGRGDCRNGMIVCDSTAVFIDGGLFDNNPMMMALEIYRKRKQPPGENSTETRVLYIDTGKLRGAALRAESRRVPDALPADRGMAALMQLASGFLPAARQYELQGLARSLADDERASWIRVTTRSQPMIGDYLGGFAAFLGRPLREYDFYTGIYDGLQFAAKDMTNCNDDECISGALRRLITDPAIDLGPLAPHAVTASYRAEYGHTLPLPEEPTDSLQFARLTLLRGMITARDSLLKYTEMYPWDNTVQCRSSFWETNLLCRDGFTHLLHAFANAEGVDSVLNTWRDEAVCKKDRWRESPDECPAEHSFERLVSAPSPFLREQGARFVHQLWRIEDVAGNDPRTTVLSQERLVEFIDFAYHGFLVRRPIERGWHWDPSSIQRVSWHRWKYPTKILPYSLSFVTDGGAEIGYRPGYNLGPQGINDVLRHWAIITPVSSNYRAATGWWEFIPGLGVHAPLPWPWISSFDVVAEHVFSAHADYRGANDWALGINAHLAMDRARLGVRIIDDRHPSLQRGKRVAMSVGINDFNGIIYWLGRFSR